MIGRTLSHYRILEQLGAGGMGVVWRARDDRLERDVAVKLLPEGALTDESARARFRTEALALSRANHPGIATVYEFDRDGGADFLVMELVPGSTLAERIAGGPVPESEAARIGAQIARALAAAHEHGVVHRDLKPGNVAVTPSGQIKVLDFGLAKLLGRESHGRTALSSPGAPSVAGTLAYMSPEQLMGAPVDVHADLYALGVVLYEMVTARLPHHEQAAGALVYSIVHTPPIPPSRLVSGLSPEMERIILRALEKSPARRYASATELASDLERLAASGPAIGPGRATPASRLESLAVLPLANLSGDPSQEFFSDGMTEALIANLAQTPSLRVISRTSVMRFKGVSKPLPEIARELGVDAIVEGSVLRAGNRVRISAQLIEAAAERHLWASTYERDMGDILALQSEVACAIVEEIRGKVSPAERRRIEGRRVVVPEAYDAYLLGRYHWNKRTPVELKRSIEHFNAAIAADPSYALAYSGLADAYNILGDINAIPPQDAAQVARGAARKSLELDANLAEPHTSLGFSLFFYDWDWEGAEKEYRQSIAINPSYATAHQWYSTLLNSQGRFEEALAEVVRAQELDPLAFIIRTGVADAYFFARRYDPAIDELRRTVELEPRFSPAWNDLGRVLAQAGRHDEAIATFLHVAKLTDSDPGASPGLAHSYAMAGRQKEARAILDRLVEETQRRYISPYAIAGIFTALGEIASGLEWLERAHRLRDRAMVWIKVHPRLDPLRGEPRFQELMRKMRFA